MNLISLLILALVIRHIQKIRKQMKAVSDAVDVQMKVNNFITVSHFAIALASTISQLLYLFTPYSTDYDIK